MSDPELWRMTVRASAEVLAAGTLSAADLVDARLARVAEQDFRLHAFIHLDAEAARQAAREADAELRAGRCRSTLHGLPYAVKDNYDVAGLPATAGSRLRLSHVPVNDAELVTQLRGAGAVCLGKLSTWEFGTGNGGEYFDLPFPPARNPWDTGRFSGGSSTGAGVAVAAGFVPFAMGSDTTGSVRLPAAATGVVGLIPTPGRLSLRGILPNCWSLDNPGPLAWTADDLALIFEALTGEAGIGERAAAGVRGLRIGVVRNVGPGLPEPDADIAAALEAGLKVLEGLGAVLLDRALPVSAAECFAVTSVIGPAESAAIHERELREQPDQMGFALRDKLMAGSLVRAVDYIAAQRRRREIADAIEATMREVDVLITFGALHVAPRLGVEPEMTAFTTDTVLTPFSLSAHPALIQCTGFTPGGLPLHWQMVGQRGGEAALLAAAIVYERATPWRERRPEPASPPEPPAPAYPQTTPDDIDAARRTAGRHGLERLGEPHLARLAALGDAVATNGLAIARTADKDLAPAPTFRPWTPLPRSTA